MKKGAEADLSQDEQELSRIVDPIPQTIVVLNPEKAIYAIRVALEYGAIDRRSRTSGGCLLQEFIDCASLRIRLSLAGRREGLNRHPSRALGILHKICVPRGRPPRVSRLLPSAKVRELQ